MHVGDSGHCWNGWIFLDKYISIIVYKYIRFGGVPSSLTNTYIIRIVFFNFLGTIYSNERSLYEKWTGRFFINFHFHVKC
jgi:hypothetical protein